MHHDQVVAEVIRSQLQVTRGKHIFGTGGRILTASPSKL